MDGRQGRLSSALRVGGKSAAQGDRDNGRPQPRAHRASVPAGRAGGTHDAGGPWICRIEATRCGACALRGRGHVDFSLEWAVRMRDETSAPPLPGSPCVGTWARARGHRKRVACREASPPPRLLGGCGWHRTKICFQSHCQVPQKGGAEAG